MGFNLIKLRRRPRPPPPLQRPRFNASKARIVPEAVWNYQVTVAADDALNEGGAPKYIGHGADVEVGQALVAGRIIVD
jgi:hypothetical protein